MDVQGQEALVLGMLLIGAVCPAVLVRADLRNALQHTAHNSSLDAFFGVPGILSLRNHIALLPPEPKGKPVPVLDLITHMLHKHIKVT